MTESPEVELKLDRRGLPLLAQFSEEGFIDCVLRIQDLRIEGDHYHFHLAASFNDEDVGLDVTVIRGIESGFNENMELHRDHVYRPGVTFSSSGPSSDRLLRAISSLYETDLPDARMVDTESFTAIALHQGTIDMENQAIKLKLFGRDQASHTEDDYYESFFNLDLPGRLVFWNEKDPDYRQPLLRGLSRV